MGFLLGSEYCFCHDRDLFLYRRRVKLDRVRPAEFLHTEPGKFVQVSEKLVHSGISYAEDHRFEY